MTVPSPNPSPTGAGRSDARCGASPTRAGRAGAPYFSTNSTGQWSLPSTSVWILASATRGIKRSLTTK